MKRVIIDTDPGVDDTAAIFLALASPELGVEALTTVYGNGTIEHCTHNALAILETAGRVDIPVYQGAGKPLMREPHIADYVHGDNALGGVTVPIPAKSVKENHAVQELIDRVMSNPGEMSILALGPLTNVALALSLEPRMADALVELIVMGGAVFMHGNVSEVATANLYNDPEAAAIVYHSGAPVVQIGLDVCQKVVIPTALLERFAQTNTPTMALLSSITPQLAGYYQSRGIVPQGAGVQYNDMPAVGYMIDPDLYDMQNYFVRISTHDELTKGQTVADVKNRWGQDPNTWVAMDVKADQLIEMFGDRVINYVNPTS